MKKIFFITIVTAILIMCSCSDNDYSYLDDDIFENGQFLYTDGSYVIGEIDSFYDNDIDYYEFCARDYKKVYDTNYQDFTEIRVGYQIKVKWVSGEDFIFKAKTENMSDYYTGDESNDINFNDYYEKGKHIIQIESADDSVGEYKVSVTEYESGYY